MIALKNKIFSIVCISFVAVSLGASFAFKIDELNIHDSQQVTDFCNLFANKKIQKMTGWSVQDAQTLIRLSFLQKSQDFKKDEIYKIYVCKNPDDFKICATLVHKISGERCEHCILAVHKDYRRHGIASYMMQETENLSCQNNVKVITVAVLSVNKPMIHCCLKAGYHQIHDDAHPGYVVMYKQI